MAHRLPRLGDAGIAPGGREEPHRVAVPRPRLAQDRTGGHFPERAFGVKRLLVRFFARCQRGSSLGLWFGRVGLESFSGNEIRRWGSCWFLRLVCTSVSVVTVLVFEVVEPFFSYLSRLHPNTSLRDVRLPVAAAVQAAMGLTPRILLRPSRAAQVVSISLTFRSEAESKWHIRLTLRARASAARREAGPMQPSPIVRVVHGGSSSLWVL